MARQRTLVGQYGAGCSLWAGQTAGGSWYSWPEAKAPLECSWGPARWPARPSLCVCSRHPSLGPPRRAPPARVPARALPSLGCAGDARPPALRLLAAGRGAMELSMKKFTVRRFFSVYLRKKSRSKSSSLSRLEVKALPGSAQDAVPCRASSGHVEPGDREPFSQSCASSPQERGVASYLKTGPVVIKNLSNLLRMLALRNNCTERVLAVTEVNPVNFFLVPLCAQDSGVTSQKLHRRGAVRASGLSRGVGVLWEATL